MKYKALLKYFTAILLVNFLLTPAFEGKAQKLERSLFWEISGKDLKKPSYLFGTYHFADKGFADTMKQVNAKLAAADVIVGELIIDSSMAIKLMPYMMLKNTSLDQLLSPVEYQAVASYMKRAANLDLKNFNAFTPVAVQTFMEQVNAPKTFTATNPPIDQFFQDYARKEGKKLVGLETLEEQAAVLFGSSLARQKEQLLKSVKDEEKNKEESRKMYPLYVAQDLESLGIFFENDNYTSEEMDRLLKDRNLKWMAQLPLLMKDNSLFIAVGAGHLIGNEGLIKGLRRLGYTVKPLRTD